MRLRKPGSSAQEPSKSNARARAEERRNSERPVVRPAGRREALKDRYSKAAASVAPVAKRSGAELVGIARELVRLPAAAFMRVAEIAGAYVLRAWLLVWPLLVAAWQLAGRGLAIAQREVTPARATVGVALLTAVALAGSQWADLREVSVGADSYVGLEDVATAPPVETKTVGSAHAWLGLPLALFAALVVVGSAGGRPKLARLLIGVGIAVVVISLAVDRPVGLDKGTLDIQYESVVATLLQGFWAQLVSGAVLILLAPVLMHVLSPTTADADRRRVRDGSARKRMQQVRGLGRRRAGRAGRTAEAGR